MRDFGLSKTLDRCRRQITSVATSGILAASHRLGPGGAFSMGRVAGQLAGLTWPMRKRLATNFKRAGITPTSARVDRYFRRFGCWISWSLAVYHHGFVPSGVAERVLFDDSVSRLDQAAALGRGVILIGAHGFCHDVGAAAVNRRHPVTVLARESKSAAREAMKKRWYQARGIEMACRPRRSSVTADTMTCIRTLRRGRALAITPDVLVSSQKGVSVQFLGREVFLSPGIAVLAMRTGAPLVPCWYEWHEDRSAKRDDRVVVCFDEPIELAPTGDRGKLAQETLQAWCVQFEQYLKRYPENWMFWLDKRWTKVLRGGAA